ncbi:STAS domain-containing protein [Kineococcus sp. SYSU DK004]|uniref:STAS domain-containing protein n=1 Tax=Kineococcus sp. SYSU DK004 TaxID=3383125 RepID=UPI003D7DBE32
MRTKNAACALQVRRNGPVTVVAVHGALVAGTATTVRTRVDEALDVASCVVVDLSGATRLDCHALGALLALAGRAQRRGGALRLAAASPAALAALAGYDLLGTLGGAEDLDTAFAAVAAVALPDAAERAAAG